MGLEDLETHFEFGRNWSKLIKEIDEKAIQAAMNDIRRFTGKPSLEGLSFLDVGCGSGLSSLAAVRLGASSIHAVDIDPINVENTKRLMSRFAPTSNVWSVRAASIVDDRAVSQMPQCDVVYAWGVLHHTGEMWTALANCAKLVKVNGWLYLMLYRDARLAPMWGLIKRTYNRGGPVVQWILRNGFAGVLLGGLLLKGRNPRRVMREYAESSRGMSWFIDVTDWVGGYPFEFTSAKAVIDVLESKRFKLVNIAPPISPPHLGWRGTGSYQYLFQKIG